MDLELAKPLAEDADATRFNNMVDAAHDTIRQRSRPGARRVDDITMGRRRPDGRSGFQTPVTPRSRRRNVVAVLPRRGPPQRHVRGQGNPGGAARIGVVGGGR